MAQSKAGTKRRSVRETISFVGWHLIMLAWLAGWLLGAIWVWPVFASMELNVDLISAVFWLVTGAVAWVFAFMMGCRRYWQP